MAIDNAAHRDPGISHIRHLARVRRRVADDGVAASFVEAMVAVTLAVACASILVEWRHLDPGQWVIRSAASVVTGDAASARRMLAPACLDRLQEPDRSRLHRARSGLFLAPAYLPHTLFA
jgi:hypothetical protein